MTEEIDNLKVDTKVNISDIGEAIVVEEAPMKKCNVATFMAAIMMGGFHVGFAIGCANQLATLFDVKYGWDESQQSLYQSLIGSSVLVGMASGAMIGGKIIRIGRRRTMMIMNLVGIFGVAMTLVQDIWMLLLGRVIYGLAVGICSVCLPRYVEEYVPLSRYSLCIALYAFSMNVGSLFALCSAIILPKDTDTQALLDDQVSWRCINGIPIPLFFMSLLAFLFVIKYDGPSYYLATHREL